MSSQTTVLRLYVSEECELCDRAIAVLAQARAPDFECVGIEGNAALEQRYGVRVPVLYDSQRNRELGWPFDADSVVRFLDVLGNES
ncbi:glutaredoxin family protein [Dokdonella sp.]|uniref:glutaredoxin family protein n=1 Tax=Dokdonella sp. TaxID=2291710 RepID=UPI003528C560